MAEPGGPPEATAAGPSRSRQGLFRPRLFVLIAVLVLVAAAVAATVQLLGFLSGRRDAAELQSSSPTDGRSVTEYRTEDRAEPVTLVGTALSGEVVDVADWRGDVVVINVWGSWCAPCREEAPILASASADYAGRGVRFLGINVRDNPAAAIAFEENYGITYPSIDDRAGNALLSLAEHLPGAGVPVTLVLDREGRPAARVLGAVQESALTSLIDTVLDEPTLGSS